MKFYVVLGHCDHDGWTHSDTDVYGVYMDKDKANAWIHLAYEEDDKLHGDDDIYDRMCYWVRETEVTDTERYFLPNMPPVIYDEKEKIIGQDICGTPITESEDDE
jgi:hypothetical protein